MDGLILLVILIPIVFLFLLISILQRTGDQRRLLDALNTRIQALGNELSVLNKELNKTQPPGQPVVEPEPEKIFVPVEPPLKAPPPVELIQEPVIIPEPVIPEIVVPKPLIIEKKPAVPVPPKDLQEPGTTAKRDLEKFIGENIANKIGITVLVLGIAFFVKYAIDKNWIQEGGRVIIGLIAGSILIGLAHYFHNKYRSFSSVLVGGGLTVFYFSIAFAFHQYHLIGQTTAFIIMVAIAGFAVLLSLFYDRQELAILATIGGFITPFLVSTAHSDHIALFTYLCILNCGLIALSWFKRWPAINIISLFFTTIIFGAWLVKWSYSDAPQQFPHGAAFLFATAFYVLFVAMNIINVTRLKDRFTAFDFILLLSVNFLYYTAGVMILELTGNKDSDGLFTFLLGVFNLLLLFVFRSRERTDRSFISLLLGLSLSFISLAVPVQFKGHHITLFWLAEAILLLFLYQRTRMQLLKIASLIIAFCMLSDLLVVWIQVYFSNDALMPIAGNKGFITGLAVAGGLFIYHRLVRKEQDLSFINDLENETVKKIFGIGSLIVLYLSGMLELYYQFSTRIQQAPVHILYLQLFSFVFFMVLLRVLRRDPAVWRIKLVLTAFSAAFYLFTSSGTSVVAEWLLANSSYQGLFVAHWLSAALLLGLLVDLMKHLFQDKSKGWTDHSSPLAWFNAAILLCVLSIELYQLMLWTNPTTELAREWWENLYYKAGLSILWSICSFVFIWLGMRYHLRTLRVIALSLFTITLAKLFIFDIRNIPPGGKIAAFILLGCLLLTVSFMYQRLKRIIIDRGLSEGNTAE